jgi:hypothetical protein
MMMTLFVMGVIVTDEIDSNEEDAGMEAGQNRRPSGPFLDCRNDFEYMQDAIKPEYELGRSDQQLSNLVEHHSSLSS